MFRISISFPSRCFSARRYNSKQEERCHTTMSERRAFPQSSVYRTVKLRHVVQGTGMGWGSRLRDQGLTALEASTVWRFRVFGLSIRSQKQIFRRRSRRSSRRVLLLLLVAVVVVVRVVVVVVAAAGVVVVVVVVEGVALSRPRAREVAKPHGHAGTREVTPGRLKSHHKHSCTSLSARPRTC